MLLNKVLYIIYIVKYRVKYSFLVYIVNKEVYIVRFVK